MQKTKLAKYIIILLFLMITVVFTSCANHSFINIRDMQQTNYIIEFSNGVSHQLSAVCTNDVCKFIVFDAIGMPIVNKEYKNNRFINKKFLPPNDKYNMLFAYIIEHNKQQQFLFFIGDKKATVYKNY